MAEDIVTKLGRAGKGLCTENPADYVFPMSVADAIEARDTITALRADLARVTAARDRMREALEPFARQIDQWGEDKMAEWDRPPDALLVWIQQTLWNRGTNAQRLPATVASFSYGDLRRARAALAKEQP